MTTRRISEPGDVPFRPARVRVPHQVRVVYEARVINEARMTYEGGITPRAGSDDSLDLLRRVRDGLKRI